MSFFADKKKEHEGHAEKAAGGKNFTKAAFHAAKAAEYGLKLAEQSEGKIAKAHLEDALGLIAIAEEFKQKPPAARPEEEKKREPAEKAEGNGKGEEWLLTERPNVRFADIAGMEELKQKLQEIIVEPLKHPERALQYRVRPGGGILLFGPPGNGKTFIVKAIAGELEYPFYWASGAQIRSKWHGESEQRLRKLVQAAKANKVAILFLDEVEAILPKRGGESPVDNRMVTEFLTMIGGFEESQNTLLLLAATNLPWQIDDAVFRTGRFDEKIFINLPDAAARQAVIQMEIDGVPVDAQVDAQALAGKFDGYTVSDIKAILASARRAAFSRSLKGGQENVLEEDIESALKTIPKSVTPKLMKRYEEFAETRFA